MIKKIQLSLLVIFSLSCSTPNDYGKNTEQPNRLHRSIKQITDIIVHDIFSPPVASRIYAYVAIAGYEAARHADSTLVTFAGQLHGLKPIPSPERGLEYCFPLASVQATLVTGRALIISEDKLDEFYKKIMDEFYASGIPDDVYERSVAYGTSVAEHIIQWSTKDNYKQTRSLPKYSVNNSPSTWKPTPPAYMDAIEPHWNKIRPFIIDSASQFRCIPPPSFSIDPSSKFYGVANEVYETAKNLTDEQREIASFWDCNPFKMNVKGHVMFATKKISPGGHWMNITHVASVKSNTSFARSAEAYARVAIALADAFIACWDEKYRSLVIRPESYINQYIDEDWVPLLQTPPFPEYVSGHSTISGSAAGVLTKLFGDNFAFTDSTEIEFGMPSRSFNSFNAAADEAAVSRLYGGIHYRTSNEVGLAMGRKIAGFVNEKLRTRKVSS
jgi:hypothetical protein